MKYLLDTNALIGLLFYPDILSKDANRIIQESDDYISALPLFGSWE